MTVATRAQLNLTVVARGDTDVRGRQYIRGLYSQCEDTGKYKSTTKQTKSIASKRREVLPDSGEREATQTARMTNYTGTEVGDEFNLTSPQRCPTPGNSGREGPELSVVELSVFTR